MRDENGLRRQWALLRALASRRFGLSIRDMGVTERTIHRDLDLFRGVGFPLEEAVGEFGRKTWTIKAGRDQPPLAFTFDEAIALYLGRRLLEPLAGTPFAEAARHAFLKIRATLSPGALDYVERFSATFHLTGAGLRDYAPKSDLIEGLQLAIEDGREARVLYRSDGDREATHRVVHPHGMTDHRGRSTWSPTTRRATRSSIAHPGFRGATRSSIKAPSRALPRLRALCRNSKNPRSSGSLSCESPRWGRSHDRSNDQNPSIVLTWTSQKPSPSSSRANSPAA
jgi:hypothetical protein